MTTRQPTSVEEFFANSTFSSEQRKLLIDALNWLRVRPPVGDGVALHALSQAMFGTPGGPPTGAAGGDLQGTYPNPTLINPIVMRIAEGLAVGHNAQTIAMYNNPSATTDILATQVFGG